MNEPLRDRLAGRWGDILPQVGVPAKVLTGRHQPCPMCAGKDRFRFDPVKGLYICNQCGGGDGIALAMKINGWDFKTAVGKIEPLIGNAKVVKPKESTFDRRQALNGLWKSSRPITPDTSAGRFLTMRTGITEYPSCLRAVDSMRHWDGEKATFWPGMIAMVTAPDDKPASLYRTYLTKDGLKAPVDEPRMMMPGQLVKGCAVRLAPPGETLGSGEGIESSIAAGLLHGVPVWATLGTGGLMAWEPPAGVKRVVVFGDADKNFAGQSAAFSAGHRLLALPGRPLEVEVRIPGMPEATDRDWNDVLLGD